MCKGEVVRQKHPSWGTPPRFLFDCAQRYSVLVRRRGDAAPLLSSARFSTYVFGPSCLQWGCPQTCRVIRLLNFWWICCTASQNMLPLG